MSNNNTQPEITLDAVVQRNEDLLTSNIGEEVVMMSIENSAYYGLDPVGSKIWDMLDKPVSVSDLCEHLQECFDVSPQQCQKDVLEFLIEMQEEDMLVVN